MSKHELAKGGGPPKKRDIWTDHAGPLYMHFDRMRMQHDWSYATGTNSKKTEWK